MWKDLGFIREIFFFLPKFFFISFSLIFFGGKVLLCVEVVAPNFFFGLSFNSRTYFWGNGGLSGEEGIYYYYDGISL